MLYAVIAFVVVMVIGRLMSSDDKAAYMETKVFQSNVCSWPFCKADAGSHAMCEYHVKLQMRDSK